MFSVSTLCNSLNEGFLALGYSQNMASSKNKDVNIKSWTLFRNSTNVIEHNGIVAVHVFNKGRSAFLCDEYDDLFEYGAANPCFSFGQEAVSPRMMNNFSFNGVEELCTGEGHAVLLDCEGAVHCWGDNSHGQLGVGNTHSFSTYRQMQLPFIIRISCGQFFTIALDASQDVWFWGRQFKGPLIRLPIRSMPTLVTLQSNIDILCISAGLSFASVIDTFGRIHTWGHRECGIDYGYRNGKIKPVLVEFGYKIQHMVNSATRSAFTTEDRRLFISGSVDLENYFVFTEIMHCGRVTSVASSWILDKFALSNVSNAIIELKYEDTDALSTVRTPFKSLLLPFKDLIAPSVIPRECGTLAGFIPCARNNSHVAAAENTGEASAAVTSTSHKITPPDGCIEVASLFSSKVGADIEIKFSDGSLHAHRLVLFLKSKYFKKIFEENANKSQTLDMTNWSSGPYKTYIKYLYTGKIEFDSTEHIPEIYLLAEQDSNNEIKNLCHITWKAGLTRTNIVRLYQTAFNYKIQEFELDCAQLLAKNLLTILDSEEYRKLPDNAKLSLVAIAGKHGKL